MRRWTKRAARLLTLALCLALLPSGVRAASTEVIRVGLYYGTNALPTANLANEVGSGYRFGSYAEDGTFTAVGSTSHEKITICKDSNLYLSGGSFYETPTAAAYTLVGAYHLQVSGTYPTFEEAAAAAAGYPYGFPAYVGGTYVVRFEFYSTAGNAQADAGKYPGTSVVGASASCYTVVDTATGSILFEYDSGGWLGVEPIGPESEPAQTWFKGYCYYGGFQYMRRSGNDLSVVNFVSEDLYVAGVLPYEFVASGSLESLKAGAVAIRTFARATVKHAALGFDICATTDCQVYQGVYTGDYADMVLRAVEETAGECAYYNGQLIQALYFSSDGGATEDAANAWGTAYPYLVGKEDPYEKTISFNGQSWSYQVTPAALQTLLQKLGKSCGTVTGFAVTGTTANGNVNEITITDSAGKRFVYSQDDVRILQNLSGVTYMSRRFTIRANDGSSTGATTSSGSAFSVYDGNTTTSMSSVTAITATGQTTVSAPAAILTDSGQQTIASTGNAGASTTTTVAGGWTITGSGYGHNIGMSQWGAYAMGRLGYTYDEILKFYYTGITIR